MIELTHVGERLIAEMLNSSPKVRELFAEKSGVSFIDKGDVLAVPEVPLAPCGSYRFDVAHKIDVGLLLPATLQCIPIEAKLGVDRLAKNEFDNRFLRACGTAHGGTSITGSMVSILERKLPVSAGENIEVRSNGVTYQLSPEWVLVVREQVLSFWGTNGMPALSPNCRILTIEEIVSKYGDVAAFNDLVTKLLSADYYRKWFGVNSISP